jgi:hypothetical protein
MKVIPLTFLCITICFLGCGRREGPIDKAAVSYVLTKADGTRQESSTRYIRNGQSFEEIEQILGFWRPDLANATGSLHIKADFGVVTAEFESTLVAGLREGVSRTTIGKISLKESYLHDEKHGPTVAYLDGAVWYEGEWTNGAMSGRWTINAPTFKPAMISMFQNDKYHGITQIYDMKGSLIAEGEYKESKPINGSFVANPQKVLEALKRREKSLHTILTHFRDGTQVDSSPITIMLGI